MGRGACRVRGVRRTVLVLALGLLAAGCSAFVSNGAAATLTSPTPTTASTSTTAPPSTTTTHASTTAAPTSTTRDETHYSQEELDYFAEIAGTSEFGPTDGLVHKWVKDLRIAVHGDITPEDRLALDTVIADLNRLVAPIRLVLVEIDSNVEIYFTPSWEFASIEPHYVPGNSGFFMAWADTAGNVTRARVLISSESTVSSVSRAHLIREEITQTLYLPNDSMDYPESIFYQDWTTASVFAPIDEMLLEMLYRPEIVSGMTIAEAVEILAQVIRG